MIKKILLTLSMGTILFASVPESHLLDRVRKGDMKTTSYSVSKEHTHAMRRTFKTPREFRHVKRKHHKIRKHMKSMLRGRAYESRYAYKEYDRYQSRGFRQYKNRWYLAFKYERASFYDNEGFFYGYFNRRGYTFEGEFYRYDRYYTYRDRIRGKGLFSRRYFRPMMPEYRYAEDYMKNERGW